MFPDAPGNQLVEVLSTSKGDINKAVTLMLEGTVCCNALVTDMHINFVCSHKKQCNFSFYSPKIKI